MAEACCPNLDRAESRRSCAPAWRGGWGKPAAKACAGRCVPPLRRLTVDEVARLVARLDGQAPLGLLVRFAAFTGLRAGLRVRDLDLGAGHVEVRRTLQRVAGSESLVGPSRPARRARYRCSTAH